MHQIWKLAQFAKVPVLHHQVVMVQKNCMSNKLTILFAWPASCCMLAVSIATHKSVLRGYIKKSMYYVYSTTI